MNSKRREKEFQIGKVRIFLIVVQTGNGSINPTTLIIIPVLTKVKPFRKST